MKKLISLLLAVVIAVPLAACSAGSDSSQTQSPAAPAEQPSASESSAASGDAQPADSTELVVWCWDEAFNVYSMRQGAELYSAQHPEVTIDVQNITDINVKLTSALLSNQYELLPDIILVQDRDLDNRVNTYDPFEDITNSGIDFSQFAPYKVQAATSGGKIYGVPFDNGVACYVFRSDLLEQCGFTVDDLTDITWREFIDIGVAVKEQLGIPMLKMRTDAGFTLIEMMMQSAGSWYFNEAGELNIDGNEVLRESLDLYLEMVEKGVIMEVADGEQYNSAFYDGSAMGTVNASWVLATVSKEESLSGKWQLTNVPRLIQAPGATNYTSSGGCNWAVIKTSENKDVAIDLLKETVGGGSLALEFYDRILEGASVIASYLPLEDSASYQASVPYYGGQSIYSSLISFSSQVPRIFPGWYTAEARTAIAACVQEIHAGTDREEALGNMKATLEFQMVQ